MRLMSTAIQVPYVLSDDKDEKGEPLPGATTFQLRCLTASEDGALDDGLVDMAGTVVGTANGEASVNMGDMQISIHGRLMNRLRLGICGWDTLTDPETGEEIPFTQEPFRVGGRKMEGVPLRILDRFPKSAVRELARKIENLSTLTHAEGN